LVGAWLNEADVDQVLNDLGRLQMFNEQFHKRQEIEFINPFEAGQAQRPEEPEVNKEWFAIKDSTDLSCQLEKIRVQNQMVQENQQYKIDLASWHANMWQRYSEKELARKEWFRLNYRVPSSLQYCMKYHEYTGEFQDHGRQYWQDETILYGGG